MFTINLFEGQIENYFSSIPNGHFTFDSIQDSFLKIFKVFPIKLLNFTRI